MEYPVKDARYVFVYFYISVVVVIIIALIMEMTSLTFLNPGTLLKANVTLAHDPNNVLATSEHKITSSSPTEQNSSACSAPRPKTWNQSLEQAVSPSLLGAS